MFKSSCINKNGCLEGAHHFFSQSKIGLTVCLVVEVASLIIGILAITHVLPGIGAVRGAVLTGLASPFFLLTTVALVFYGCRAKKTGSQKYSIIPSDASVTWKEKLEVLRMKNQQIALPPPKIPPEECLYTLSMLAQAGTFTLFKESFPFSEPKNETLKKLLEQCQNKKDQELYFSIASTFLENLPSLTAYIRDQTQAVLLLEEPTKEMVLHFKLVNKQIRMILLFLMSHESNKLNYFTSYQDHVSHTFGNRQWSMKDCKQPCYYFGDLRALKKKNPEEFSKELNHFLFAFSTYRRHSLLRLFPQKIEVRASCKDADLRILLSATWFHGTRATTSLSDTDFTLIPTGWLNQAGHISFFGEMGVGCLRNGVNAHSLSGTHLDHVDWSVNSYATGFQFSIENEIKIASGFLEIKFNKEDSGFYIGFIEHSNTLPRIEVAIKRWATWDPASFKEKMPLLLQQLKEIEGLIAWTNKTKPHAIFYGGKSNSYFGIFQNFCHSLEQIKAFLSAPLPPPLTEEQKKNIEGNFPAVLGSMTLLSNPCSFDDSTGEHLVPGTAEVGKDLQLLCVKKEDSDKAKKWVDIHNFSAKVQIFSFEQLEDAQKINKKISPFLADIFSLKKFKKLCGAVS